MTKIKLKAIDTRAPEKLEKDAAKAELGKMLQELDELQNLLYAEAKHSILVVVQGMDGSGKDGLIKHVFTSMNPQGVNVISFKVPTAEETAHDFLWRVHKHAPPKGMIHVFNRSHYESVLITRVHGDTDSKTARQYMDAINDFERLLILNGTYIIKLYLHVSHKEQKERLMERVSNPKKMWKYDAGDLRESEMWKEYMKYYEDIFTHCSEIPWHIVPADENWYKSYVVAGILLKALKSLKMKYPHMKE